MAEKALELKVAVLVKGVEAECGLSAVGGAGACAERVLGEATGEFGGAFRVERSKGTLPRPLLVRWMGGMAGEG